MKKYLLLFFLCLPISMAVYQHGFSANKKKSEAVARKLSDSIAEKKVRYYDLEDASGGVWVAKAFANTLFWGYAGVEAFVGTIVSESVAKLAEELAEIAMAPIKKMIHVKFDIWFKKNFPPTEYQLAKRADKNGLKVDDLVFNDKVAIKVASFVDQLKIAAENNEPLPSLLLYGPPGTGKTEIAKRLVNEGKFEVIIFSAGELKSPLYFKAKFDDTLTHIFNYASRKRAQNVLSRMAGRIFRSANQVEEKIVIFIDEGEELLSPSFGDNRSDELQAFLIATGTKSPNFTVVVTTNFISKIDDAAYRRFSYRIEVENPDEETRLKIIRSYIKKYQKRYPGIKIDSEFLADEAALVEFYQVSAGLAGRELERIAQNIALAADRTEGKLISKDLLLRFTQYEQDDQRRLLEEREKEEERRKQSLKDRYREEYLREKETKRSAKKQLMDQDEDDDADEQ